MVEASRKSQPKSQSLNVTSFGKGEQQNEISISRDSRLHWQAKKKRDSQTICTSGFPFKAIALV